MGFFDLVWLLLGWLLGVLSVAVGTYVAMVRKDAEDGR